jgi:predicted membrane protein
MNIAFNKLYDGIVLISVGIVLMLNVTGLVDWRIWLFYVNFWPLIIILIGFKLILSVNKNYQNIVLIFQTLLFIVVMFGGVIYFQSNKQNIFNESRTKYTNQIADTNTDNAIILKYDLKFAYGKFVIVDTDNVNADLVKMDGNYNENFATPKIDSVIDNKTNTVTFTQSQTRFNLFTFNNEINEYNFTLKNKDTSEMKVDLGAGDLNMTLNSLYINDFIQNIGAGNVEITIQDTAMINNIEISVGAGKSTLIIPKNYSYKVDYQIGAGSIVLDDDTVGGLGNKATNVKSDNYSENSKIIKITANIGAGQVVIKHASK